MDHASIGMRPSDGMNQMLRYLHDGLVRVIEDGDPVTVGLPLTAATVRVVLTEIMVLRQRVEMLEATQPGVVAFRAASP